MYMHEPYSLHSDGISCQMLDYNNGNNIDNLINNRLLL